jgi:hypothetical protein
MLPHVLPTGTIRSEFDANALSFPDRDISAVFGLEDW